MKDLIAIISLMVLLTAAGCKSSSGAAASAGGSTDVAVSLPIRNGGTPDVARNGGSPDVAVCPPIGSGDRAEEVAMLPKASAIRMSGDYAQNVAVTLDAQGNLTYFPAPSDISAASAPLKLDNGWWLNRQGIGPNSVFTRYTFAEYAALPTVPTPEQLKAAIIPGAQVTAVMQLPFSIAEASDSIPAINEFIKSHSLTR